MSAIVRFQEEVSRLAFYSPQDSSAGDSEQWAILALGYGLNITLLRLSCEPWELENTSGPFDAAVLLAISAVGHLAESGVLQTAGDQDTAIIPFSCMDAMLVPIAQLIRAVPDSAWPGCLPYTPREIAGALDELNRSNGFTSEGDL